MVRWASVVAVDPRGSVSRPPTSDCESASTTSATYSSSSTRTPCDPSLVQLPQFLRLPWSSARTSLISSRDRPSSASRRTRARATASRSRVRELQNFNESGMVKIEDDRLAVVVASQTNLVVELTEPIIAVRPLGRRDHGAPDPGIRHGTRPRTGKHQAGQRLWCCPDHMADTTHTAAPTIVTQQRRMVTTLPLQDADDFADADRGFLGRLEPGVVRDADGRVVWDSRLLRLPATVRPPTRSTRACGGSRAADRVQGLYEVVPGIYQVRGLDLSNVTLHRGRERGVVVIDPLISHRDRGRGARPSTASTAATGRSPASSTRTPTSTTSAACKGVTTQDDVDAGRVVVLAPAGFVEHAVAENVYAGTAMARRAGYMYGAALARGPRGQVGAGLGQTTSTGTVGPDRARPSRSRRPGRRRSSTASGWSSRWRPDSEAPAEMHVFLPDLRRAVHGRERHAHPAQPPDAARRAGARRRTAGPATSPRRSTCSAAEPTSCSPRTTGPPGAGSGRWSSSRCSATSTPTCTTRPCGCSTRASSAPRSPSGSSCRRRSRTAWHAHGYYGSVSHNVKAIYQRYMGWYDGNPAHLWPHPPVEAAHPLRGVHGRGGRDGGEGAAVVRRGRLPLGGRGARPRGVRRARPRGRPRAARGHVRAARLRRGERHLALRLSLRRARAAPRRVRHPGPAPPRPTCSPS